MHKIEKGRSENEKKIETKKEYKEMVDHNTIIVNSICNNNMHTICRQWLHPPKRTRNKRKKIINVLTDYLQFDIINIQITCYASRFKKQLRKQTKGKKENGKK